MKLWVFWLNAKDLILDLILASCDSNETQLMYCKTCRGTFVILDVKLIMWIVDNFCTEFELED